MRLRTFPKTTSAALLAVLTLASAASADCAWVLWRHGTIIGVRPTEVALDEPWRVIDSWPTNAECERDRPLRGKRDADSRETPEAKQAWKYLMGEYADQTKLDVEYLCLPDTVDPRKAKGK
jgi:hypothetical protein